MKAGNSEDCRLNRVEGEQAGVDGQMVAMDEHSNTESILLPE